MMRAIEAMATRRFRAELDRALSEVIAELDRTGAVPVRIPDHEQRVAQVFEEIARAAVQSFGARILIAAGQGKAGPMIETKDFRSTLARLAARYLSLEGVRRRIVSIAETTRAQVVAAVQRGYDDGIGQAGIAAYVREVLAPAWPGRAEVIARTEVHGASQYGAMAAAQETGLDLRKKWISAEDAWTRESHAEANGQEVGMDEAFEVGGVMLMYPGDPNAPPEETINCRCVAAYIPAD